MAEGHSRCTELHTQTRRTWSKRLDLKFSEVLFIVVSAMRANTVLVHTLQNVRAIDGTAQPAKPGCLQWHILDAADADDAAVRGLRICAHRRGPYGASLKILGANMRCKVVGFAYEVTSTSACRRRRDFMTKAAALLFAIWTGATASAGDYL